MLNRRKGILFPLRMWLEGWKRKLMICLTKGEPDIPFFLSKCHDSRCYACMYDLRNLIMIAPFTRILDFKLHLYSPKRLTNIIM